MIKKFGLQLYTVREFMRDPHILNYTFGRLKEIGYDEAQTAGYAVDIPTYAKLAKDNGITIVGTHHGNLDDMMADPDKTMREHEILGTTNIGIGGMPNWARENGDTVRDFCEKANKFAEIVNKEGFKFTYHHHSFEFKKVDGDLTMMDILVDKLDPVKTSFVLDTYWIQHGGGDVRAWIEKLAGRIDILHLKDMAVGKDGPFITSVGAGNINFKGAIETAEKTGVKYYVVEQDANWVSDKWFGANAFKAVESSAEYIKANLM